MQDSERKSVIIVSSIGVIPVVWLALIIAPFLKGGLSEIVSGLMNAFSNPFNIQLCEDSLKTVLIFLAAYGMAIGIYFSTRKNYRRREEHGSAKWGNAKVIDRKYRQSPPSDNKLMTQNVRIGINAQKHRRNLNTLVCGGSGAGKTTLISIIVNILKSDSGQVLFSGKEIQRLGSKYFEDVGYLPQYPRFYQNYTAQEFLEYIAVIKDIKGKKAKSRIDELFEFVNLQNDRKKKIGAYSGGMRQRLGIAQALLNNPKLLILDEPTAGLDPKERIRFRNLISQISNDKTVILATHIVTDVESIARKVIILGKGRIICNDNPENLTASIKDKVWSFEVERDEIEPALLNYAVSNVQYVNDGFSIKTVGEKPIEHAVNSVATLEEAYLYYVGESGGKK